jgi:NAD(P)-dependent dehydrogenase (short-subunit alcohol dehydrogenase family)
VLGDQEALVGVRLRQSGDAAAFFECNVMEEESIDAAVAAAHAKFGALHGAVNCAGGSFWGGLTVNRRGEAHSMDTWWKTVQLNAFGTFAVCSKVSAITALQEEVTDDGERGVLVNVASVAAQVNPQATLLAPVFLGLFLTDCLVTTGHRQHPRHAPLPRRPDGSRRLRCSRL